MRSKVVVNQRVTGEVVREFVEGLAEGGGFAKGGRTLHNQRNEIKVFEVGGSRLVVKRYRVPPLLNRVAYTYLRKSKAERAYGYGLRLLERGVLTPEPVGYVLTYRNGLLRDSYYVSRYVDHDHTMYELGKGGCEERLLCAFGRYTSCLHEGGILHLDYSPGNILFRYVEGGEVEFCLIDINRMRFGEVSVKRGCAGLARLWGDEATFRTIAGAYAKARGADVALCIKWVMKYRRRFWRMFRRRHGMPY
jgi:hypothetical protein